jgi:hypothetical protein
MGHFWVRVAIDASMLPVYKEAARKYPDDPLISMFLVRALELAGEKGESQRLMREFQKRMAASELSKPQPPEWYEALFQQIKQELAQNQGTQEKVSPFSKKPASRRNQLKFVRDRMREMVTGMVPWRLAVYREAAKRFPKDPFILVTLWQALEVYGKKREAKQVMDALVALWDQGECKRAWPGAPPPSELEGEQGDFGLQEELPSITVGPIEAGDPFGDDLEGLGVCSIEELRWYDLLFEQIERELEANGNPPSI